MKKAWTLSLLTLFLLSTAHAAALSNKQALKGLSKVNIVCDITVGDPQRLITRMVFLDETYTQLLDAGVKPGIVMVFRGPASRFVTRTDRYIKPAQRKYRLEMADWIAHFGRLGFVIEQCGIAAKSNGIDRKDFLPQVRLVANGYVSLVGYQSRGYALLPMD